ncbi:hypothetical protein PIB30_017488 [Stylosanthes scabra]|uniref:Uncharacterized protein n=1 Tax=Stylosanthes scabra TaxID=79078 RepID=A0ABU6Q7K3_9FABA|nr:hypothetical protein [Stylosanthes scabra]
MEIIIVERDEGGDRETLSVEGLTLSPPSLVRKRKRGEFGVGEEREGQGGVPCRRSAIPQPRLPSCCSAKSRRQSGRRVREREEEDDEAVKVMWTIVAPAIAPPPSKIRDSIVAAVSKFSFRHCLLFC